MDTVFQSKDGNWYFWDETWTWDYGPYASKEMALAALALYCKQLMGN